MPLKLVKNPTFITEARINVPTDDGLIEQTVSARFRVMPPEDMELPLREFVGRALINVDGIIDEAGALIEWTPAVAAQLLPLPYFALGLYRAYDFAMAGAKQGN